MARMTAARAAVEILKREGIGRVRCAGRGDEPVLRGAQGVRRPSSPPHHPLARHVEGASHMAEGYTRTRPGNMASASAPPDRPAPA
ncbi:Glyoxylate carboligase [Streptomyces fumanus]